MDETDDTVGHRLRGPIDGTTLILIRDVFTDHAPLATASVDEIVDPSSVTVELTTGFTDSSTGRFDIQWTEEDDYKFHYTENELDFRWGHHPHGGDYGIPGYAHFHPPPDASSDPDDVEPSCFTVRRPDHIARGVLENVRKASETGLEGLNSLE